MKEGVKDGVKEGVNKGVKEVGKVTRRNQLLLVHSPHLSPLPGGDLFPDRGPISYTEQLHSEV